MVPEDPPEPGASEVRPHDHLADPDISMHIDVYDPMHPV